MNHNSEEAVRRQKELFGQLPALPENDREQLGELLDPDWHILPSFNDYFCRTAVLPWRIRYTFDYGATAAGNRLMYARVAGNLRVNQTIRANLTQRIMTAHQQLGYLSTLPRNSEDPLAENSKPEMQKTVDHISSLLFRDEFWAEVLDLEVQLSYTALMRVRTAGQAKEVLKMRFEGKLDRRSSNSDLAVAGRADLRRRYAQYQDLRDKMVALVTRIEILLKTVDGCVFDVWERHRNELWDVWGDDKTH